MRLKLFIVAVMSFYAANVYSQTTDQQVKDLISKKDSLFWIAYNKCDIAGMESFLSKDVEFYHDMGGAMYGRDSMLAVSKRNLCSGQDFWLRREAIPGTVKVFPMKSNGVPYGAIISGEHLFYINGKGKKEFLDGHASFSQLWILKHGEWTMSRILSYDHHPAKQNTALEEKTLSPAELNKLAGKYKSPKFIIEAMNYNGKLKLVIEDKEYILKAASASEFFMTERDLKFIFSNNKLIVKERDEVVEEAVKQ